MLKEGLKVGFLPHFTSQTSLCHFNHHLTFVIPLLWFCLGRDRDSSDQTIFPTLACRGTDYKIQSFIFDIHLNVALSEPCIRNHVALNEPLVGNTSVGALFPFQTLVHAAKRLHMERGSDRVSLSCSGDKKMGS